MEPNKNDDTITRENLLKALKDINSKLEDNISQLKALIKIKKGDYDS